MGELFAYKVQLQYVPIAPLHNKCPESSYSVSLVPASICYINHHTLHIHGQLTRFLQCPSILQGKGKHQTQH
jgi:hypothetical protein